MTNTEKFQQKNSEKKLVLLFRGKKKKKVLNLSEILLNFCLKFYPFIWHWEN